MSIKIDTVSKSVLRMSAFWEGGRGAFEFVIAFVKSRQSARVKRMGCTVNVYRNESKQRMKPKDMIFRMVRGTPRDTQLIKHSPSQSRLE
jgi:hypothetical protein